MDKGSGEPHKTKVGSVTRDQIREIATTKMPDLNAKNLDAAEKIVAAPRVRWASTSSNTHLWKSGAGPHHEFQEERT